MRRHIIDLLTLCLLIAPLPLVGCTEINATRPAMTATSEARVLESDLDMLLGPTWRGTLTYLDYTTERRTTHPLDPHA